MKLLSVIVPVYNIEEYIERCLTSIIQQDFDDMEIIVVNDGSTDGSLKIVYEIATKDQRIKIVDKANGGSSSARNAGLRIAQGKYVLHIDGDDWIEQGYLRDVCSLAEREDLDIVVTDFFMDWNYEYIDYKREAWALPKKIFLAEEYIENFFLTSFPAVWNKIFKRSLYTDNNIWYPEHITNGEDLATTPRLIYYAKRIGRIERAYVHYVQRDNSITYSMKEKKKFEDLLKVKEFLQEFFDGKEPNCFIEWKIEILLCSVMQEGISEVRKDLYDICINNKNIYIRNNNVRKIFNLLGRKSNYSVFKLVLWYKKLEYKIKGKSFR